MGYFDEIQIHIHFNVTGTPGIINHLKLLLETSPKKYARWSLMLFKGNVNNIYFGRVKSYLKTGRKPHDELVPY